MKILILGSMSFAPEMKEIGAKLTKIGFNVRLPEFTEDYTKCSTREEMHEQAVKNKLSNNLYEVYHHLIEQTDFILIVNEKKKNIDGYIGANALIEMGFAKALNKKIFLLNPIPEMDYQDEIIATTPTILNGDLSKIPSETEVKEPSSLFEIAKESNLLEEGIGITFDDKLNKLTQEFGELNDAIQKYRGRYCKKKSENLEHIEEELGDVMLNLISICTSLGINPNGLDKFAFNTLKKFRERKETYKENLK